MSESQPSTGTQDKPEAPRVRKRVLFVDQTAQLGGAELCLKDYVLTRKATDRVFLFQQGPLEHLLRAAGVDVSVKAFSGQGQEVRKQSGVLQKIAASLAVLRLSRAVAKAAGDMDVIYANTPKALVVSAVASWFAKKPLIYHLHDILSVEHFSRSNLRLLVGLSNWRASHVIANSESSKAAFISAGGTSEVTVCYNGFDPEPFERWYEHRHRHRERLRSSLGLSDQPIVAVFGRFAPWKGQHIALEALRHLPNIHLLLVGDSLFGEEDYKRQLERIAASDDLADRIHFLGFRDDVGPLMQAVDGIVHCSTAPEPFGRVIVEAMLSRCPIVASRAGGAQEIIEDGRTGIFAQPGNALDLANRIQEILRVSPENTARVDAAYQDAIARFSLEAISTRISKLVTQVAVNFVDPLRHKPKSIVRGDC